MKFVADGSVDLYPNEKRKLKTTLNINDDLIKQAKELTGIRGATALVHAGLKALIGLESAKRLAKLGGSEPRLKGVPRHITE